MSIQEHSTSRLKAQRLPIDAREDDAGACVTGGVGPKPARTLTAIEPGGVGRMTTHGEIWKAIATDPIAEGDGVAVTNVDGMTLTVRKR